jgi:signal transduction histidine kinase
MTFRFGIVETYFFILSLLLFFVALLAWNRRPLTVARSTSFALTGLAVLTAGYALVLAAEGIAAKVAWYNLHVVGICSLPIGWLLLSLSYAGHARALTRRNIAVVSALPVLVLLLAWTNGYHHLFLGPWREVSHGAGLAIVADPSLGYWAIALYTLAVTPVGLVLLVREVSRARLARRRLLIALLLAAVGPYAVEVANLLGHNPIWPLDTTMFAFTLSGVAFAYVFFRRQSLELVPFALGTAVDEMSDGLVVADTQGRVMHVNPAAARILGCRPEDLIEQLAGELVAHVFARTDGQDGAYYDVRATELLGRWGRPRGRLILIRDVSELKCAEIALVNANEKLEQKIAQRTASLIEANTRLEEAVRVGEAAERRARRLARQVVSAQEEERRRIARDLHDEAGQLLNALKLWLSMAGEDGESQDNTTSAHIDHIKEISDSAIDSIRRVVWELRPPTLDSAGVNTTLGWLCSEYTRQFSVPIEYHGLEIKHYREELGITLYRCLQESLNNVVRHARAGHAWVRLCRDGRAVRLTVEDDGCGIPADHEAGARHGHAGLGIQGMAERAVSLEGDLTIEPREGGGTRVTVILPVMARRQE